MKELFSKWLLLESTQEFSNFCTTIIDTYPHEDNAVMVASDYLSENGQDFFASCLRILYGQRLEKLTPSFLARLFGVNAIRRQTANQIFSSLKTNLSPFLNSRKTIFPQVDPNYRLQSMLAKDGEYCGITFSVVQDDVRHQSTVTLDAVQHYYYPNQDVPGSEEVRLFASQLPVDARIDLFFAIIKSRLSIWFINQTEKRIPK